MLILYIILGIIQGFTEPIPVSSSGHLVIFRHIFNLDVLKDLNFEIFANFGSLLAIIFVFRKDVVKLVKDFVLYIRTRNRKYLAGFRYCLLILIGTIPAGICGLLFKNFIEEYLSNVKYVGAALLLTALFLFLIRNMDGNKSDNKITIYDALKIGFFQVVALFPGISRSGATIVGGMFSNLKRETAFKFSFMLYIPISFATMILGVKDVISSSISSSLLLCYIFGMVCAGVVTFFTIKWFKGIMLKGKLMYFVYYCILAGILVLLFL